MTEIAKILASNTSPSNAGCEGSIPVWGAKIPHSSQPKKHKTNIVMNAIKTKKKKGCPHQKVFKKKKKEVPGLKLRGGEHTLEVCFGWTQGVSEDFVDVGRMKQNSCSLNKLLSGVPGGSVVKIPRAAEQLRSFSTTIEPVF